MFLFNEVLDCLDFVSAVLRDSLAGKVPIKMPVMHGDGQETRVPDGSRLCAVENSGFHDTGLDTCRDAISDCQGGSAYADRYAVGRGLVRVHATATSQAFLQCLRCWSGCRVRDVAEARQLTGYGNGYKIFS
jgi:hypothetical protein